MISQEELKSQNVENNLETNNNKLNEIGPKETRSDAVKPQRIFSADLIQNKPQSQKINAKALSLECDDYQDIKLEEQKVIETAEINEKKLEESKFDNQQKEFENNNPGKEALEPDNHKTIEIDHDILEHKNEGQESKKLDDGSLAKNTVIVRNQISKIDEGTIPREMSILDTDQNKSLLLFDQNEERPLDGIPNDAIQTITDTIEQYKNLMQSLDKSDPSKLVYQEIIVSLKAKLQELNGEEKISDEENTD